jgi:hypothetical protein
MPNPNFIQENPLIPSLNPLEQAVIKKLLEGEHPILDSLRTQLAMATISSREYSGAGFFIHFTFPVNSPPLPSPFKNFEIGHVEVKIPGPKYGVGVVLFVRNGLLDWIEGYTNGPEPWPKDTSIFEVEIWEQEKKKFMDYLEKKAKR